MSWAGAPGAALSICAAMPGALKKAGLLSLLLICCTVKGNKITVHSKKK
jgi:hypothetical protein